MSGVSGINFGNNSPFSPFLLKGIIGGPDLSGLFNKTTPEAVALASVASVLTGPAGKVLTDAIEHVGQAVAADPQGAAKLLREATQLTLPVIQEIQRLDSADDGTKTVVETTTTVKTEREANRSKTTKTTTTTRERTTDPVKQQEKLNNDLEVVQKLVDGLEDGKIQIGDSTVTFNQLTELATSLIKFLDKGSKKEEASIDIGSSEDNDKTSPSSSV